ncbi:hypothetical protein [Gaoshiqia sp. Z1-71]|uniref:hypothetical protein n=1 Tax=Gaoshiqia hydrogeniformans TaxID=3290090 RepID=UPI003BF8B898
MLKIRNILSFLLLSVYFIVLAHQFIPHHHHADLFSFCSAGHQHDGVGERSPVVVDGICSCHHGEESDVACYFSVDPVPSKILLLTSFYLVKSVLNEVFVPVVTGKACTAPDFILPKIFADHPSGLRAPPVIS